MMKSPPPHPDDSPQSTTRSQQSRSDNDKKERRSKGALPIPLASPTSVTNLTTNTTTNININTGTASVSTSKTSNTKFAKFDAIRQMLDFEEQERRTPQEEEEEDDAGSESEFDFDDMLSTRTEIFPTSEAGLHVHPHPSSIDSKESIESKDIQDIHESKDVDNETRFQSMDIQISICGVSGILYNPTIKTKSSKTNKKIRQISNLRNSPNSNSEIKDALYENSFPVLAVVSAVALPNHPMINVASLPLRHSSAKTSTISRYNALWPSPNDHNDEHNDDHHDSSIVVSTQLERDHHHHDHNHHSRFIPHLIELQVGIALGDTKLLPLASSTIVISEEVTDMELHLPLQSISNSNFKSKSKSPFSKLLSSSKKSSSSKQKYSIDDNASLRVQLTVVPEGSLTSSPLSHYIHNSTVEIGTDNVAALWKMSPIDDYEVVEYTPPNEHQHQHPDDSHSPNINHHDDDDHNSLNEYDHDPTVTSPPSINSKSKSKSKRGGGYWNCFDPSLALYKDDDHLIFLESMVSDDEEDDYDDEDEDDDYDRFGYHETKTFDETVASDDHRTTYEEDEDDDENDHPDDNKRQGHREEAHRTRENDVHHDNESIACSSYDSHSSASFSATLRSIHLTDGSGSTSRSHSGKKVDEKSVQKARDTIRKFADRIGIDPEDLI